MVAKPIWSMWLMFALAAELEDDGVVLHSAARRISAIVSMGKNVAVVFDCRGGSDRSYKIGLSRNERFTTARRM